jgi:hypothetical protein
MVRRDLILAKIALNLGKEGYYTPSHQLTALGRIQLVGATDWLNRSARRFQAFTTMQKSSVIPAVSFWSSCSFCDRVMEVLVKLYASDEESAEVSVVPWCMSECPNLPSG